MTRLVKWSFPLPNTDNIYMTILVVKWGIRGHEVWQWDARSQRPNLHCVYFEKMKSWQMQKCRFRSIFNVKPNGILTWRAWHFLTCKFFFSTLFIQGLKSVELLILFGFFMNTIMLKFCEYWLGPCNVYFSQFFVKNKQM